MEIEMFFAKYDVDGDGEFSYEEGQQLIEDLDNDMIDMVRHILIDIDIKYSDIINILYLSPHSGNPAQDWATREPAAWHRPHDAVHHQPRGVRNVRKIFTSIEKYCY